MARKKKQKVETISLGFKPHKHQYDFCMNWKRYNMLICTRRWGKSVIAALMLTDSCLEIIKSGRKKQPKFAYIAPQKDQAKQITWPIFKEFLAPLIERDVVRVSDQSMEVYFMDGKGKPWGQIKLYAEEKGGAESIRGNYLDGVVFDEYDSMDASVVWRQIVRPALGDTDGWALFAGTIAGKGNLYNLWKERKDDERWNIGIYPFEECWRDLPAYCNFKDGVWVPAQDKYDDVQEEYRNAPNEYAREYQCDWDADGVDPLIPNEYLREAIGRHINESAYEHAPRVMGIDVAGEGPDSHTICKRQGNAVFPVRKYNNISERDLCGIVAASMDKWEPDMVFIDHTGGYGTELLSRLQEQGYTNVRGINFGSKACDPDHYANIRSEMFHKLRDWVIDGGALPDDADLEQELSVLSCVEMLSGKAMLMKKDDIREMIGRSPDKADALALTFAAPVRKRIGGGRRGSSGIKTVSSTGYRPLEHIGRRRHGII